MRKKGFPTPVGSILNDTFRKRGWQEKLKEYAICTHWDTLVGPSLSGRCAPLRLRHNKLFIAVSTSSWLTQLQFMKLELIDQIQAKIGVRLHDIHFRVSPAEVAELSKK